MPVVGCVAGSGRPARFRGDVPWPRDRPEHGRDQSAVVTFQRVAILSGVGSDPVLGPELRREIAGELGIRDRVGGYGAVRAPDISRSASLGILPARTIRPEKR